MVAHSFLPVDAAPCCCGRHHPLTDPVVIYGKCRSAESAANFCSISFRHHRSDREEGQEPARCAATAAKVLRREFETDTIASTLAHLSKLEQRDATAYAVASLTLALRSRGSRSLYVVAS